MSTRFRLWFAASVMLALPLVSCGPPLMMPELVGTTTTTAAPIGPDWEPSSLGLYAENQPTGCAFDVPSTIYFLPGDDELDMAGTKQLQRWGLCLTTRQLERVNVVIVGGDDEDLFARRADRIRGALARRGVRPSRVLVSHAGGPLDQVRIVAVGEGQGAAGVGAVRSPATSGSVPAGGASGASGAGPAASSGSAGAARTLR